MITDGQRNVFGNRKMVEELPVFKNKPEPQPFCQSMVLKNRHFLAEQTVCSADRCCHAARQHQKITLARALQPANRPEICCCDGPVYIFNDQSVQVSQSANCNTPHLTRITVGRFGPSAHPVAT